MIIHAANGNSNKRAALHESDRRFICTGMARQMARKIDKPPNEKSEQFEKIPYLKYSNFN